MVNIFYVIFIGVLIFLARIVDVSLGTFRTISIINGRVKIAFLLGFLEVSIWLIIISAVIKKIYEIPILGLFYALGFATGNVVGIILEKRLAIGHMAIRAITSKDDKAIAEKIRSLGYSVTTFKGEGLKGAVTELFIVSKRNAFRKIIKTIELMDPDIFYVTEYANILNRQKPLLKQPPTGWRAIFKKK